MNKSSENPTSATSSLKAVIWLFLCFLGLPVQADVLPFKAEYEVKYMRMRAAEVKLALEKKDESDWLMTRSSKAIGMARLLAGKKLNATEQSWFKIEDSGLTPNKFLSEKPGAKKGRRRIEILFSDTEATVDSDDGQSKTFPKTANSQDQVSAVLAVMLRMQGQQEDFTLPIMARRGESVANFEVLQDTSVKTPAGVFNTIHIVQKTKKRTTSYWLAKDNNMIPVKISHQEKDSEGAVMFLKKFSVSN